MTNRTSSRSALPPTFVLSLALTALFAAGCGGGDTSGAGSVKVQISGEDLAVDGFSFPEGGEVVIADGWEIELSHVLVSVGKVWLSEGPDTAPSDQSQTGDVVAEVVGPWIVDLARQGDEPGAGGEGTAILVTTIERMNRRGDAPLTAGDRYAFSYDLVAAEAGAVLLGAADDSEVQSLVGEMSAGGYAVYYTGTATWKGAECQASDATYDFSKLPSALDFALGFATPVSYLNCQNQENQGEPFPDEEYQRGVTLKDNEASLAQMTIHVEHPFYSETQHEPAVYFDQLAALLVGRPAGTVLTMDAAAAVDPSSFTDAEGAALPWRTCDGSTAPSTKERYFDTGTIPIDPAAHPGSALRDYRDFVHYVQSTQGHMNGGEGICFTRRNYPSPL